MCFTPVIGDKSVSYMPYGAYSTYDLKSRIGLLKQGDYLAKMVFDLFGQTEPSVK